MTSYRLANSAGDAGNYNTFPLHRASSHLQGRLSLVPTSQGRLSLSRSHFTGPSLSRSHFTGPTLRAPLSGILKEGCRKPVLEVCSLSLSLSLSLSPTSSLSLHLVISLSLSPVWPSLSLSLSDLAISLSHSIRPSPSFPLYRGSLSDLAISLSHSIRPSPSFPLYRAVSLVPASQGHLSRSLFTLLFPFHQTSLRPHCNTRTELNAITICRRTETQLFFHMFCPSSFRPISDHSFFGRESLCVRAHVCVVVVVGGGGCTCVSHVKGVLMNSSEFFLRVPC